MKKSLFAIAAVTAFAGAAQAQSSVTVYGIMDMGYSNASGTNTQDGVATKSNAASTGSASSQTTSRLGFRGTEDLGGGTSAFFTYELGLAAMGQSSSSSLTNRVQFIGLRNKALGSVAVGRQYQSIHSLLGMGGAEGQNNVVGTIYSGASTTGGAVSRPYAVFMDNAITYVSPNMAGFTLELQTGTSTSDAGTAGASGAANNAAETGGSIKYTGVKNLNVGLGFSQKSDVTAGTLNRKTSTQVLAANYNFGVVQPFFLATQTKIDNQATGANFSNMKLMQVGVRAPITPKIGVWASAMTGSIDSDGNNAVLAQYSLTPTGAVGRGDVSGFQLGTAYNFSKRTNLYAIYGKQSVKGKDAATGDKLETTQYAVGVRHRF